MEIKEEHKPIWIKLRAEVIKHFHDTENAGKFNGGFSLSVAMKLAEAELIDSCITGWFVLSLDEMLLKSLDECVDLASKRLLQRIKLVISINNDL